MIAWEIHCPGCGVIIRTVSYAQARVDGCPDCKNLEAIFLEYKEPIKETNSRYLRMLLP